MALTERIVAEDLRQRLGLPDASQAMRFLIGIPEVLKETGRKVAQNPFLRPTLLTPRSLTTAALTAGAANLGQLYSTNKILIEYIDRGQIYHLSSTQPLRRIPIEAANLPFQFDQYAYYYVQGDSLFCRDYQANVLTGSINLSVPFYPATLANLPATEEIERLFLDKMYEWALSNQDPNNDAAADGAK